MKTTVLNIAAVLFVLLIPFAATAQNWTAEQQEVMDHIKSCWDAWEKAFEEKNFDIWAEACPCDEDHAMWWTNEVTPESLETQKRGLTGGLWSRMYKRWDWLDLRPLSVKIDGDVALVHFHGIWVGESYKGEVSLAEHKRFEVFRKKNGQWTFIGGMVSPVQSN